MTQEKMITTFDGTQLYFKKETREGAKAAIVLVHGLCEHLGRYDYVTERFLQAGLNVYRFDHRGHGKSGGKRAYFSNYEEIAKDVRTVVEIARKENSDIPVFLLGHSMGGHAVALFGTKYPGMVDGIITSGAVTRYNHELAGPLPMPLPKEQYLPNELGEGVCSDPKVIEAYNSDPLVEKAFAVGLMNALGEGIAWLKEHAEQFKYPVLILHGARDGLVSELDSRMFFGEIGSEDKSLHIYSGLCHEILNEPCRDKIIDEILDWLKEHRER